MAPVVLTFKDTEFFISPILLLKRYEISNSTILALTAEALKDAASPLTPFFSIKIGNWAVILAPETFNSVIDIETLLGFEIVSVKGFFSHFLKITPLIVNTNDLSGSVL